MPSRSSTESSAITTRTAAPRRTTVGPPVGLARRNVPVDGGRPGRAGRRGPPPGCSIGAAAAVVAHVDEQRGPNSLDARRGLRRRAVLGQVGQRLGDDEVGGRPRSPPAAARRSDTSIVDRHRRCAPASAGQRGVEAAVGEHLRVDAAHELAQLADRRLGLLVRAGRRARRRRTGRRRGRAAPWPCRGPSPARRAAAGRRRAGRARCAAAPVRRALDGGVAGDGQLLDPLGEQLISARREQATDDAPLGRRPGRG